MTTSEEFLDRLVEDSADLRREFLSSVDHLLEDPAEDLVKLGAALGEHDGHVQWSAVRTVLSLSVEDRRAIFNDFDWANV